jgi:DNA-directed RNA polymerase specialized sigma24 family protein
MSRQNEALAGSEQPTRAAHKSRLKEKLMQVHSNTDRSSLDTLIVACSEPVQAMAWGFARSASVPVEADEMYSIGMVEVCEAAARGAGALEPVPYLCKCAKYAMCAEWRRLHGWSTTSLDAPLSADSEMSLLDVLPAPAAPAAVSSLRSRAANQALDHLTALQRAVVRRRYGLPGYGSSNLKETARALQTTVASVDSADRKARRSLARDYRLCKALGVEVAR